MIVICDKAQDIVIPAGLGDNAGVVYEKSGVESLNGQQGDLTLKTVNGNELLGEGNVAIDTGVESLNGQKGALTLKTVNGNELTGEGNIEIQAGVESVNGETGAVKIKSVNGQSLVGDGDIEIQAGLKYKQITNESRQEVYDDVKAHWVNASGYTGDYVYFYQNGVDQIIFDEVKFENNTAYFNSASVGYTSGQVHNPLVRLLCCIVPSEGNIQINENGRVLSDVNGMRYEANDAIVDSNSITFQENGYGDGYDVYNTTDTGTKDGLFDVRFKNGLDGFKGNAPASIFTDGTDVFMAFDVVDNHYVYKRDGNAWAFVSKTKIGGESGGDQNVIVLDGLTQEEVKAIYDKLDKTKVPDAVFVYLNSYSFRTYWDGEGNLNFDIFRSSYEAIELNKITVTKTGEIYRGREVCSYTNSCVIQVDSHVNETDPFECSYIGSFLEYLQRVYNKPYAYFIWFKQGYGASTKPVYAPFTVIWDNNNFDGTSPVRIQFIANEKLYTYLHGDTDNKWLFESAKPITGGGNQNVIVLDGLTQEERKAVYDKLDKTKAPDEVFVYDGKTSVRAYWGGGNYLKFITFNDSYDGLKVEMYSLNPDGNLEHEERGMTYTNSVLMHLGNHVDESGYFECMYIGNFSEYILRPYTRPNACFINLEKGIGDSTRPIYAPVSTLVEKYGERTNVRMQFFANEKLYTFLLDANQENKWIFESAKPITGGGSGESPKTYYFFNDPTRDPNAPNAHNVEVFREFDKAVQEGGAFNNFYIVNGNETSGQTPLNPILQVTKMEAVDNGVWGGNKGYYVFAGQKNNVETEKLQVHKYCLTDIGGVIDFMVNAVDGGTWTSGVHSKIDDVLTAGADIPFVFEYLEGCDETYFWADNMGGKQGLYNITFNGGYDGYKGNVVADVYGNATGVYMAFTVNNVRYTYKKNDTNSKWELAKSVQIGGVQSSEVSNIKVLTQSEYDALTPKDPNTMYCIKG